jgi:hypothetical protein
MTVAFNWNVVQMDCYPEVDNEQDVVFTVHWTLTGTEDTLIGSVYGSVGVTLDAESPFTPYSELTKEQVVGWVKDALGEETVAATEANVAQQIQDQIKPKVVTPPLPWVPVVEIVE